MKAENTGMLIFIRFSNLFFRSLVTTESQVNLRLQNFENGKVNVVISIELNWVFQTLRIEIYSPDHDSLVFRCNLDERYFKEHSYFIKQQLTFEFKSVYQVICDFVRSMATEKNSFIKCLVHKVQSSKSSSEKYVCELGFVSAAMTSKPSFKIQLDQLSGAQLIEHLEKITDIARVSLC
jgi:hypothetical protein